MKTVALLTSLLLLLCATPAQEARHDARELEEILHGLNAGIEALQRLGHHEEAVNLARIAGRVEAGLEGSHRERDRERSGHRGDGRRPSERDIVRERAEIMRMAMGALREGEKKKLTEQLEHAIHSLELGLEGRRDDEARRIREAAPKIGQQAEILGVAAELFQEFAMPDRAEIVAKLARELGQRAKRQRAGGAEKERAAARRQLELLRQAYEVLTAADKGKAANNIERMVGAQRVRLEGKKGDKARAILQNEPKLGAQAEVVLYAAKFANEFGRKELAQKLEEYGKKIAERARRARRR